MGGVANPNLISQSDLLGGYINRDTGDVTPVSTADFYSDNYIATNGETVFTFSSPDYVFKGSSNCTLAMYDSDKKYLAYQNITAATQTLSNPNTAYIRFSINFVDEGGTVNGLSDWLSTHRYKLEKGSVATMYYNPNLLTGTGYCMVTGTSTYGYISNETNNNLIVLFQGLEGQTVTVSFDYEYSGFIAGSGNNRIGWEIGIVADSTLWSGKWYSPTNSSGSGRISSTFVVPKNITGIKECFGYIQFSGSGTGTVSHFKLEQGSEATPYTPY